MKNEEYISKHPEQFKDDIDKWLFTEFGIIGGCCSAEKSHEYSVARMVAERYKKNIVDKTCEYIRNHIDPQLTIYHEQAWCKRDEFIGRLKEVMEE